MNLSRKIVLIVNLLILILLVFSPKISYAGPNALKVNIDGKLLDNNKSVYFKNGIVMMQLNEMNRVLHINTNVSNSVIELSKDNKLMRLTMGSKTALFNNKEINLITKPIKKNGEISLPLRSIAENFGYNVQWSVKEGVVFLESQVTNIPVLIYHHFENGTSNGITVDPKMFREQMSFLKAQGYTTINDRDLIAFLEGQKQLPEKPIMITMDDGYESNYIHAYPVLKELGMKATIYTVVSTMGTTPGDIPHMTWKQAKEMYNSGVMEIQNHTFNLHYKGQTAKGERPALSNRLFLNETEETLAQYEERIRTDLQIANAMIEENIGNKVVSLAYPYGDYNPSVKKVAQEIGLSLGFTTKPGINDKATGRFDLMRINVPGGYTGKEIVNELINYNKKKSR